MGMRLFGYIQVTALFAYVVVIVYWVFNDGMNVYEYDDDGVLYIAETISLSTI